MAEKPPSFDKLEYWDNRYSKTAESYDWLNVPDILDEYIDTALALADTPSPRLLHIGCGNSELSFNLRSKVKDPGQIQNVDYSSVAIEWGKAREKSMFDFVWEGEDGDSGAFVMPKFDMPMSKWTEVDLLSIQSVISNCDLGAYSVVVDKSTCDSLACTSTTEIFLPYFLYTDKDEGDDTLDLFKSEATTTSTLQILAVHLALLARPQAQWVAYSYSSTRFDFLKEGHKDEADIPTVLKMNPKLPHPAHLWTFVESKRIAKPYATSDAPMETTPSQAGKFHFIYILERTEEALNVRTS